MRQFQAGAENEKRPPERAAFFIVLAFFELLTRTQNQIAPDGSFCQT